MEEYILLAALLHVVVALHLVKTATTRVVSSWIEAVRYMADRPLTAESKTLPSKPTVETMVSIPWCCFACMHKGTEDPKSWSRTM